MNSTWSDKEEEKEPELQVGHMALVSLSNENVLSQEQINAIITNTVITGSIQTEPCFQTDVISKTEKLLNSDNNKIYKESLQEMYEKLFNERIRLCDKFNNIQMDKIELMIKVRMLKQTIEDKVTKSLISRLRQRGFRKI